MDRSCQELVTREIWRLYVADGTHWYSQKSDGGWRHVKKSLSFLVLEGHLRGDMTLGLPCPWNGSAKFLTIDVDTVEGDNLRRLATCLRDLGVPHLLSFSGNKGFHADLFVKESEASEVAKAGRLLSTLLCQEGVAFDHVYPTSTGLSGKTLGGANIKLPLGRHRRTGLLCHCLGEGLGPASDPLLLLRCLEPIDLGELFRLVAERLCLDVETGEVKEPWESRYPRQLHHSKPCVNVLWQEGLQAPSTRHAATMVIATAVALNKEIAQEDKEPAVVDWVVRMYWAAMKKGFVHGSTTFEYAIEEARRLYEAEAAKPYFGVTCINRLLRPAMKSACRDPIGCHLGRNGKADVVLLTRLGVFNPANSAEPGIGRAGLAVYLGHEKIAEQHAGKHFPYEGRDTYAAPLAMLRELSGCSEKTVKIANRAVRAIGLVVKVPTTKVPKEFRKAPVEGQRYVLRASFYCLPDLSEDYIRDIVLPKARRYRG